MRKLAQIALFSPLLAFLGPNTSSADQVASTSFKGLNSQENSVIIDPAYAQDLLNVDVTVGGKSVKKRSGYGVYKALATGKALHGGYHAYDSSGNDYQLWGSSTSLYGIVADGTPTQLISSATLNSTWDCADTQANSYCVNSSRDFMIVTAGATTVFVSSANAKGTMVESTPDRLVVAGVSGAPNTLFVSQSNTFTNFTTGINATDAFTEVIGSPGSRITHIRWGCGKLLWWKDQSFGYFDFDDQYVVQIKAVSDVIGTFDNTSAIDPGGRVWFRGQDGHTWMYDCSVLEKQSIDITPQVLLEQRRTANSWTQTTQADWNAGNFLPAVNFSMTIVSGDIVTSSFSAVDTSTTNFLLGSFTNTTTYADGSVHISTNNAGDVDDNSFENGTVPTVGATWTPLLSGITLSVAHIPTGFSCTQTPHAGSQQIGADINSNFNSATVYLMDSLAVSTWTSTSITQSPDNSCGWGTYTLSSPANIGKRFRLKLDAFQGGGPRGVLSAKSYVLGGTVSIHAYAANSGAGRSIVYFDNIQNGSSTLTSGSFTSQSFDTSISSNIAQIQANWTLNTSTPAVELQTSPDASTWRRISSSTGTNATSDRYLRYLSSFTVGSTESALTTLDDVTVVAKSTGGVFLSQVRNSPNFTSWSTFGANTQASGGSQTFYVRASTANFNIQSTTPVWVAQNVGGVVTASTGAYMQVRDDFATTSATSSFALNDFTLNWFEGSASDQAYMLYFDNAIWQSVPYGAGQSVNNYIFKYDLVNDGWTLYNFGAGGMCVQSNTLYFGDTATSGGNVFNYGTATSDNGTAINAYWKSKDFVGSDPFLQNSLNQIDTFAKKNQGSTLTATYTTDTSSSTAYSVSLSSINAIVQSRKLLPSGKNGYVFNIQYGDTSTSSAWELLGFRIGFIQQPYRPTP